MYMLLCYLFQAQHLANGLVDHSSVKRLLFGCQRSINNDLLLRRNFQCYIRLQPSQQEWSENLQKKMEKLY